ncbi:hypothetical protein ACH5RR_011607 [Cinchona calisaya]|uniref:Uncharacterized protein n=1 Tax=Cinchona calisaya TaxID=153742 RepID=A0ABD3A5D8_9GENT
MKASLSLSACKLLNASEPEMKKPRQSKQNSHLRHKTVRQLLQKQYNADQDNEADLFTLLEPTLDPPTQFVQDGRLFSTPECNKEGPGFDKRCLERSSVHGKHLSQSKDSRGVTLISPLVLKKIKNKVLHEKYIDQLHSKEAKRKAAALRAKKCIKGKIDAKENNVQRIEAVKDAKNALVFCARDAINQFHHLESSNVNNFNKTCHDFADSSEDESGQFS